MKHYITDFNCLHSMSYWWIIVQLAVINVSGKKVWSCKRSYSDSSELLCSSGLEFGNTVPASNWSQLRLRHLAAVKLEDSTGHSSTFNNSDTYCCVLTAVVPCQIQLPTQYNCTVVHSTIIHLLASWNACIL